MYNNNQPLLDVYDIRAKEKIKKLKFTIDKHIHLCQNIFTPRDYGWFELSFQKTACIYYVMSCQTVGVDCGEGPPVPIPNTEVKLACAENTRREAARKDKQMPTLKPVNKQLFAGFFVFIQSYKKTKI